MDTDNMAKVADETLDPDDWEALRTQGHAMLDDMVDYLIDLRKRPVWQPIPDEKREQFRQELPENETTLKDAHTIFMRDILPYAAGNAHPRFMGWVQGGGNPVGMLADMLAAGLNANVGGRDQIPVEVERQVSQWVRQLFSFPDTATGLFVTGTSMANLMAVLVARTKVLGVDVRRTGLAAADKKLVAYTSTAAHACIAQAMDLSGLGTDALRVIAVNDAYQIDLMALQQKIKQDRANGYTPFFIAGTAGTVDVGAIDDLAALAQIAADESLWFHVDGAYGALAMLSPEIAPRLVGIEKADSIAFDFHKWLQVPYDAGFIMVRDGALHRDTFAQSVAYLQRETRGLAAGSPWPCDFGPDLSRGFRALKAWFTIKVYGTQKLGRVISKTCVLARHLANRIEAEPYLKLLAPVSLNIVCFQYTHADAADINHLNAQIVVNLQEMGIAAPSTTTINGALAIRVAIVNHRTQVEDIDALVDAVLALGAVL